MNYKSIITDLTETAEKVQNWENQGFAPSIEKDSVLETIRNIYNELTGGKYEQIKNTTSEQISEVPANCSSDINYIKDSINKAVATEAENFKEFILENQQRILNTASINFNESFETIKEMIASNKPEVTDLSSIQSSFASEAQIIKELIVSNRSDVSLPIDLGGIHSYFAADVEIIRELISNSHKEIIKELASVKESICNAKSEVNEETNEVKKEITEPKKEEEKIDGSKPVSNIKVDIQPPVLGFYSIPESLRTNIINELFNGDTTKAEIAVNKMCSLKSVEDLLIYIEDHFSWNPESATAIQLINHLSKKF